MSDAIILDVPPVPFEVNWRWLIHLLQCNSAAVRAYRFGIVNKVLKKFKLGVAAVTVVGIERHTTITPLQPAHG